MSWYIYTYIHDCMLVMYIYMITLTLSDIKDKQDTLCRKSVHLKIFLHVYIHNLHFFIPPGNLFHNKEKRKKKH